MEAEDLDEDLKEKALTYCQEYLGGQWTEISISEFKFSEVSGGFSNTLYLCSLPENAANEPHVPKEVLLRMYGSVQKDPVLLVAESVTVMLLSERNLGPKLYGLLPNGRLEEFIPSHFLSSNEMREHSQLIAREIAKIHALNVPVKKTPVIFQKLAMEWLKELEEVLEKDNEEYFFSLSDYKKEIAWFLEEVEKTKTPIVYCHNDLLGGNILWREDATQNEPSLVLIDFEFGSYNYRAFDFANHFVEWCFDYGTEKPPFFEMDKNKFPSREKQIEFFTAYIDQLSKEGVSCARPFNEEIECMLSAISLFASASCILWSIWSAKLSLQARYELARSHHDLKHAVGEERKEAFSKYINAKNLNVGVKEHGKVRKRLFRDFKEQYLASLPNTSDKI